MLIFGDAKRENEVIGEDCSLKRCESQKEEIIFCFFFPCNKKNIIKCTLLVVTLLGFHLADNILVLLFVLGSHMSFPLDIDLCKYSFPKVADQEF